MAPSGFGRSGSDLGLQSDLDKVINIHREAPETVLDETLLPAESGPRSGMSFRELNIRSHSMDHQATTAEVGASFWAFVYFQSLVEPEGDLAPMGSLPGTRQEAPPLPSGLLARPSALEHQQVLKAG